MTPTTEGDKGEKFGQWLGRTLRGLTGGQIAGIRRQFVNIIIVVAGVYDGLLFVSAVEHGNYYVSQATILAGVALVFAGVARLTRTFSLAPTESQKDRPTDESPDTEEESKREKKRSAWLTRLVLLAALGLSAIVLYAIQYDHWKAGVVASTASIGFLTAGAAWLIGTLLGFLFGIPHTRVALADPGWSASGSQKVAGEAAHGHQSDHRYDPSTSLEQISDWLTKIIVGVGLTQLGKIPLKLNSLAVYIAYSIGGGPANQAFALSICLYFSVCGFFFGFLWARLYMIEAFRAADEVRVLQEKVSRLENQQRADARALSLMNQLLNPQSADQPIDQAEVSDAVKAASVPVKVQIFNQAQRTYDNDDAEDYPWKLDGVISLLNALIASDPNNRFHRNYSQLSYALRRKRPPDLAGAVNAISKAIEVRDGLRKRGWRFYEFHRARCRIEQMPDFLHSKTLDMTLRDQILADLRTAYRSADSEKWQNWIAKSTVLDWMRTNEVTEANLLQN